MTTQHCETCHALSERLAMVLTAPAATRRLVLDLDSHGIVKFVGTLDKREGALETVSYLHAQYVRWCEANGYVPAGKKVLGTTLDSLGYPSHKGTNGIRWRRGLSLRPRTTELP